LKDPEFKREYGNLMVTPKATRQFILEIELAHKNAEKSKLVFK